MLELNQLITNPALVQAMDTFKKTPSPRTELDMINLFFSARLLTPINLVDELVDGKMESSTRFQHFLITSDKGEQFYLAFTDQAELHKWAKEEKKDALTVPLPAFAAMLDKNKDAKGVVINPFGANITFSKEMIENLPKRRLELLKVAPPRFLIGKLKEEPEELEAALSKYFKKKQKDIQQAWLFTALREGTQKPHYMLVVDYDGDPDDLKNIAPLIGEAAKPHLKEGDGFDVVRNDGKFAADLLEKNDPFYQKKVGLFW